MAARNSWAVSDTGGVLTVEDSRLHVGALVTPGSTNVKSRTGLRPGGSTAAAQPGLVAAQSSPDKTVKVNAFQAFHQTGRGAGTYIQCLDVATNIDLLTANPADPSLQRNDLIIAQQNDKFYSDANNTWSVKQVVGTPSGSPVDPTPAGSTDYYTLARVRVTAAATTITAGMIDDLRPPWAVALGGVIPVKNATDRGTLTAYDGLQIWRIDRQWEEAYSIAAGGWLVQGVAICTSTADRDAAITTPINGQLAVTTDTTTLWVRKAGVWTVTPVQPKTQVTQLVAQSIPNNAFTAVTFTSEDFDDLNNHDNVTNPSRFTCSRAGKYEFSGGGGLVPNGTGSRGTCWAVNGTQLSKGQTMIASSGAGLNTIMSSKTVTIQLVVNDYVELQLYQNSGGAINTSPTDCYMSARYLSE